MRPGHGCPEALHVAAPGPCAGRGGRDVGWKWLPWHRVPPSAGMPGLSIQRAQCGPIPPLGPPSCPILLLAPPLKAWQPLSSLGVGVLQKDLHGCLWHPQPPESGSCSPGSWALQVSVLFHYPQDQGDCPAVSWWSLGISKPWQQIPGPAPSTCVLWQQVLVKFIIFFNNLEELEVSKRRIMGIKRV